MISLCPALRLQILHLHWLCGLLLTDMSLLHSNTTSMLCDCQIKCFYHYPAKYPMGEFYWSGTSISTTKHIGNFWFFYVFSDTNNFIKVRGKSGWSFHERTPKLRDRLPWNLVLKSMFIMYPDGLLIGSQFQLVRYIGFWPNACKTNDICILCANAHVFYCKC